MQFPPDRGKKGAVSIELGAQRLLVFLEFELMLSSSSALLLGKRFFRSLPAAQNICAAVREAACVCLNLILERRHVAVDALEHIAEDALRVRQPERARHGGLLQRHARGGRRGPRIDLANTSTRISN